jgi:hypothetical protein
VIPHPWGIDIGKAQLGGLGLQKGELLKVLLVLPLGHLPPTLGIGHLIRQATDIFERSLSDIFRTRFSASSQTEANAVMFSTSTLDTLSQATLSIWAA